MVDSQSRWIDLRAAYLELGRERKLLMICVLLLINIGADDRCLEPILQRVRETQERLRET